MEKKSSTNCTNILFYCFLVILLMVFIISCDVNNATDNIDCDPTVNPQCDDPQCANVVCVENSTCKNSVCMCNEGYKAENGKCVLIDNIENSDPLNSEDNQSSNNSTPSGNSLNNTSNNQSNNIVNNNSNNIVNNNSNNLTTLPCEGITCSGHGSCIEQNGTAMCQCNEGYEADDTECVEIPSPCEGVTCSNHGSCEENDNGAQCICESGYRAQGLDCVVDSPASSCDGLTCSNQGTCIAREGSAVCACNPGYTPSSRSGTDCVQTSTVCIGSEIDYDTDDDGVNDTWFEPTEDECYMFELINYTRATHDPEGQPECHTPLMYSALWSAHGRNHSKKMYEQGGLYHEDYPSGQNCAYGCDPQCEMNMYMTGPNEPHCPELSHHCNIMRCTYSNVGIGYYQGTWNTQNFF